MSATKTTTTPTAPPAYVRISQLPGAALNLALCRFRPDEGHGSLHLLMLLGAVTGALEPTPTGYTSRGNVEDFPTLAQVSVSEIEAVVRRIERAHAGWKLPDAGATKILDKIDIMFNTAQERKRREG